MEHTGKCTGGILFGYLEENMRKSKDFCNEYTDKLLKEKVFPLFKKITAKTSASSIHDTLRATLEDYDGYAVGPAKHQVKMKLQKVFIFILRFILYSMHALQTGIRKRTRKKYELPNRIERE